MAHGSPIPHMHHSPQWLFCHGSGTGGKVEGKCVLILGAKAEEAASPTEFLFLLEMDPPHPLETMSFEQAIFRKLLCNGRINLSLRFS